MRWKGSTDSSSTIYNQLLSFELLDMCVAFSKHQMYSNFMLEMEKKNVYEWWCTHTQPDGIQMFGHFSWQCQHFIINAIFGWRINRANIASPASEEGEEKCYTKCDIKGVINSCSSPVCFHSHQIAHPTTYVCATAQ